MAAKCTVIAGTAKQTINFQRRRPMLAGILLWLVGLSAYAASAIADVPSIPLDDLRERYQLPNSQYIDLDGRKRSLR